MKGILTIAICFISVASVHAQFKTTVKRIYSAGVKDSFDIYTSLPVDFSQSKKYDIVFYCDANLKSGIELREQIKENKKLAERGNFIFIGIGHIGNYHVLRRRDFILPFIIKDDTIPKSIEYGHIKDFYTFFISELIPSIESSFNCSGKKTIIGHSLGGLFVFYCLFRNEGIFNNYIALSPALWIDRYSIYNFNNLTDSLMIKSYLYLSAGGNEKLNQILTGTEKMNEFLQTKKYKNLQFEYKVHPGKSHNSQVEESLKYVLQKI